MLTATPVRQPYFSRSNDAPDYLGFGMQGPGIQFQGRIATPMSLLQHRRVTYIDAEPKRAESISEESAVPETAAPAQVKRYCSEDSIIRNPLVNEICRPPKNDSVLPRKFTTLGKHVTSGSVVKEVEEMSVVQLSETPTEIVFSLHSFISASDTRAVVQVEERNARQVPSSPLTSFW